MNSMEIQLKNWIEKNIISIAFAGILIIGIVIRFCFRDYVSGDAATCLLPWYEEIKKNGSLRGLGKQVGNYNLLYQFFIAIFTYLPINALYAYKIFSVIFDIGLAVLGAIWIKDLCKGNSLKCFLAFSGILLSPIVVLNSALWAQCDSIYGFFCILTIYLLEKKHFSAAMIFWGVAFSFKLQAVFILPFILLVYLSDRKFSAKSFLWSAGTVIFLSLPGLLQGRSVFDMLKIYQEQISISPEQIFWNYPGFCNLFSKANTPSACIFYVKSMCMLLAFAILGILCMLILYKKIQLKNSNFLYTAFILTYAGVLFIPSMHERYGYIYEVLSIVLALYDKKNIPLCISLQIYSIITYSSFLFGYSYNSRLLTVFNLLTFIIYAWHYCNSIKNGMRRNTKIYQ